ncbi:MAG: hypothetical protein HOL98_15195 [Gammaproteobacteria bacterium]|jgi:Ca2+-binding EF-hand superfamily protein|nr:hypothetical protein [Gammaproteobacteria bacterium]MBT5204802.1 hypothetical protein [Gammaproteobacteria bacterium]MBT5603929.1 hypothetical protein [Gammaproteobacteria bacterium]MBT6245710.1 hypothetical protein [Gammaproteobacteria bacterium]
MTKKSLLNSIATLMVATWCAYLSADPRARILDRLDQNDDGMIELSEFKAPDGRSRNNANKLLKRADTDSDGSISRDELDAMQAEITEKARASLARRTRDLEIMFTEADTNADGLVSPEELRIVAFQKMDKNSDGYLSIDELRKPDRPIMDRRLQRGDRPYQQHRPRSDSN